MSDMAFDRIVNDFGRLLGIHELRPTHEGVCQLVFDARQTVLLVNVGAREQVLLSCPLEVCRPGLEQFELMARHNFLQAAKGVVLCTGEDGQVYAQLGLPAVECTAERLWAATQALLAEAERCELRLLNSGAGAAPDVQSPSLPVPLEGSMQRA